MRGCERACKGLLALNGSSVMWSLWRGYSEMEFVALYGCSDINVSKLYRLCTAHSYCRHIAQPANKIGYFIGKE